MTPVTAISSVEPRAAHSLPITAAELHAWLGMSYPRAVAGDAPRDVLGVYCRCFAERTGMALATLVRATAAGHTTVIAQSSESQLWADLQTVPERWDDGFTGRGPVGAVVREGRPIQMSTGDERLVVWRSSLERAGIRSVIAWPVWCQGERAVLACYSRTPLDAAVLERSDLVKAIELLGQLLDDVSRLDEQRMIAAALTCAGNASFITDLEGRIAWCNPAFLQLCGHSASDVVGQNPRLLKSGQQSLRYYRELWGTIRSGRPWAGETVDQDRNGRRYTIHQTVSPVAQEDGRITHYVSIHTDISRQALARERLERAAGTDPESGLLARARFDAAVDDALASARASSEPAALALLSSDSLRTAMPRMNDDMLEAAQAALGEQLRASCGEAAMACTPRPGEWMVFLPPAALTGETAEQRIAGLEAALREPLPLLGAGLCRDLRSAIVRFPADGDSLTSLRLRVERKLAQEPLPRARRQRSQHPGH